MSSVRRKLGTGAAIVTPFDERGAIDWSAFAGHAKRLLASGVDVVTAFGTTGEGASIAARSRDELFERVAGEGVESSRLAECVYGPSSLDAGQHMGRSLAAGCAAILLVPPFYFKGVGDEGLYRWHAEVFEAAGESCRNVILYNIPSLTGVTIAPALVERLRRAFPEVIAGVKDSGGDWGHTASLLSEHRDLAILVGHEGHLARAVRSGASGAISGIANIAPRLVAKLVRGEDDPLIDRVLESILAMPVVPAIKAVLARQMADASWTRVRAPLLEISEAAQLGACSEIDDWLQ